MRIFIAIAFAVSMSACATLSYYAQSVGGHLRLMSSREPIEKWLTNSGIDENVKYRLRRAQAIRDFATRTLALPDNDSYRGYVRLERPFVVWSLFATPEFSLHPRQWCFPIAGCVPYRGYFTRAAAQAFAKELRAQGEDVFVGGVPAYSTLGWFDDPLLSSMLHQGETATAAIIFHELAHQAVYVPDDTPFNEAFAVAVENAGVVRWLRTHGTRGELRAYAAARRRQQDFFDLVENARTHLARVYKRGANRGRMRVLKQTILADMRADYQALKPRWHGFAGYDAWFKTPINNAKLAAVAIYRDLVPDFERLLTTCDGDFARFYRGVAELGELGAEARRERLTSAGSCS